MNTYYKVKKAIKWYKVYNSYTNTTYQSGLTYYQANKLAKYLNK